MSYNRDAMLDDGTVDLHDRWAKALDWGPCAHCGPVESPQIIIAHPGAYSARCRGCGTIVSGSTLSELFAAWERRAPLTVGDFERWCRGHLESSAANGTRVPLNAMQLRGILALLGGASGVG